MREKESLDVSFARVDNVDDLSFLLDLYGDLFRKGDGGEVFNLLSHSIRIEGIGGEFADDLAAKAGDVVISRGNLRFENAVLNGSAVGRALTVGRLKGDGARVDRLVGTLYRSGDMKEFGTFTATNRDERATAECGEKKEFIFHAFDFHFM